MILAKVNERAGQQEGRRAQARGSSGLHLAPWSPPALPCRESLLPTHPNPRGLSSPGSQYLPPSVPLECSPSMQSPTLGGRMSMGQ